jgi:hypothetical protein
LVRSIPRFSRCLNPDKMSNRIKYLFPDQLSKSEKGFLGVGWQSKCDQSKFSLFSLLIDHWWSNL